MIHYLSQLAENSLVVDLKNLYHSQLDFYSNESRHFTLDVMFFLSEVLETERFIIHLVAAVVSSSFNMDALAVD